MATLAYIASPYGAIKKAHPDWDKNRLRRERSFIAIAATAIVRSKGYVPVSPVLLWDGLLDDSRPDERTEALAAGQALMTACDVFIWVDTKYSELSDGMRAEKEAALKAGVRVELVSL